MSHEEEQRGAVKILKGAPVPSVLPSKGVGVFAEEGGIRFFVLSKFNSSDTIIRTPVSFRNAAKLFFNLWHYS